MTKKELIEDLEKNIYCRLQPSPAHGIGVFAIRDIPKGVNPFLGSRAPKWRNFKCEDIMSNPCISFEVKEYMRAVYPIRKGILRLPLHSLNAVDISYFLNHSDIPNMGSIDESDDFIALRDIQKGEELFADYRMYSDE